MNAEKIIYSLNFVSRSIYDVEYKDLSIEQQKEVSRKVGNRYYKITTKPHQLKTFNTYVNVYNTRN